MLSVTVSATPATANLPHLLWLLWLVCDHTALAHIQVSVPKRRLKEGTEALLERGETCVWKQPPEALTATTLGMFAVFSSMFFSSRDMQQFRPQGISDSEKYSSISYATKFCVCYRVILTRMSWQNTGENPVTSVDKGKAVDRTQQLV